MKILILILFAFPTMVLAQGLEFTRNRMLWKTSCERVYLRTALDRGLAENLTKSSSMEFERNCDKEFDKIPGTETWSSNKPELHACSVVINLVHEQQTPDEPYLGTISEMVANYCYENHKKFEASTPVPEVADREPVPPTIKIPKTDAKFDSVMDKIEKDSAEPTSVAKGPEEK